MARWFALVSLVGLLAAESSFAQDTRTFEKDGVKYQETTQKQQYPVTELKSQTRTEKQTRVKPEVQKTTQTVWVPITEYTLQPVQKSSWNPFAAPTWEYQYVPQTRWEQRTQEVNVTVMKQETVDIQITEQVPVTRWVEAERKTVVAVNGTPSNTAVASSPPSAVLSRPGGSRSDASSTASSTNSSGGSSSPPSLAPWAAATPAADSAARAPALKR